MKLLVAVLTCQQNLARANAQRLTWAKNPACDVRFFLGARGLDREPGPDEVFLDVDDTYEALPLKLKLALSWSHAHGYTHTAKTDDDVFLATDRLIKSGCDAFDYWGRVRGASGGYMAPYCSGFLYVLSAKAAVVIMNATHNGDLAEDRFVGIPSGPLDRVSIMVKTFLRDGYMKECVRRIRKSLPECKIILVDDGRSHRDKIALYAELQDQGHKVIWLPFDSGFGAKANAAIPAMDRPYVLIASDDFDFHPEEVRAGILRMLNVLDAEPAYSVASGRVNGNPYEGLFEFPSTGTVRERRGYRGTYMTPQGITYHPCDITVNYSLIRTAVFHKHGIRWDGGEVKIGGGEHGAFFLDLFNAGIKTVYVPGANINELPKTPYLQHPSYAEKRGRARQPGRPCFRKRGVLRYELFDGGVEVC